METCNSKLKHFSRVNLFDDLFKATSKLLMQSANSMSVRKHSQYKLRTSLPFTKIWHTIK